MIAVGVTIISNLLTGVITVENPRNQKTLVSTPDVICDFHLVLPGNRARAKI